MALSLLNWAVAQTFLQNNRPDADPADIARVSLVAGLVPGAAGLIVPFVVADDLPSTEEPTDEEVPPVPADGDGRIDKQVAALEARFNSRLKGLGDDVKALSASVDEIKAALIKTPVKT